MSAFNESQISEVRQIVRLEALRAAVYSVASENLDKNVLRLVVSCELDEEGFGAEIQWFGTGEYPIGGGRL